MVAISSFSEPLDRVRHRQPNTTVFVNDNNLGKGTLYIAESYLSWGSEAGNGFTLQYPHISLHAISRDLTAFPQECIYMMLDTDFNGETENSSLDNEDTDDMITTELRLVPDDRGMLDAMFHALNVCQTLHPDPEDSFSDDMYEDAEYDDNFSVEETDSQMASLRIRNNDNLQITGTRLRGVLREGEEDYESDRVGGLMDDCSEGDEEDEVGEEDDDIDEGTTED